MKIARTLVATFLVLALALCAETADAAIGEVFLTLGTASGSYGTGSESDVTSSRVIFNSGDRYQFRVDAGWIRVESPLGILPGQVGPIPMRRRSGGSDGGNGLGPRLSGSSSNGAVTGSQNPNHPDDPEIEPIPPEIEEISASGVGDVYLAFSGRILGGGAEVFRLDGGLDAKVPTADADEGLGTGEWDARLGITSEYRFWSATAFGGFGWSYLGDPEWVELNDVVDAYAGVESEPLAGRWIISGWLAGNPEVVDGVGSRGILGLGLRTTGKWRFRLQATAGLTDGSEDFSVLFAVSHGVLTPTVGTRGPRR